MNFDVNDMLTVMAEMNAFSQTDDALAEVIQRFDDGELSEDDLSLVSAARSHLPYSEFLKKL